MRAFDFPTNTVTDEELELEVCAENSYLDKVPVDEQFYIAEGLCIKDEEKSKMNLHGSLQSQNSTIFELRFTRCHDKPNCRSEAELQEYLRQNSLVLYSD